MKIFMSCDIEGTNGICAWEETQISHAAYSYFARRMTQEVAAVCRGVNSAYPDCEILVKDAHDYALNLDHEKLPENTRLNRGWGSSPYSMMFGIDRTFGASIFTGYHSAAGLGCNPLAHTMSADITCLKINGALASEFLFNYYTSLYHGVPVVMVTGDEGLCESVKEIDREIFVVPAAKGTGRSVTSPHPDITLRSFEDTAREAVLNRGRMKLDLPDEFKTEVRFRRHHIAERGGYYPGARKLDDHTLAFDTDDYFNFLTFFMFINVGE